MKGLEGHQLGLQGSHQNDTAQVTAGSWGAWTSLSQEQEPRGQEATARALLACGCDIGTRLSGLTSSSLLELANSMVP